MGVNKIIMWNWIFFEKSGYQFSGYICGSEFQKKIYVPHIESFKILIRGRGDKKAEGCELGVG